MHFNAGRKLSEEHKRKISLALMGHVGYYRGKKRLPETIRKMSESQKGEKNHRFGKPISEEHKRRISEFAKSHPLTNEQVQKKRIRMSGVRNHSWKGDGASYAAIHVWLKTNHGKASFCSNNECSGRSGHFEYANISGVYCHDIRHFVPLCKSCHTKFDQYGGVKFINFLPKKQRRP